ncbi:hypothetical protein L861_06540 [Litchfieldella anticariensis FP35 = DSM 16096]|uniref:TIGR03750 family conjugal transfer protein n=1 Tax=Litchfieldella anticariensis (strain DSM 16096 / CECT 5854 / CIP 108499 / LMG 22089 / FP35) TaxID=1121939 RepID=S2KEH6_LITA3|nr:TIGR03750 family conjugal transfer protein [Halomonas anticariensis]EPC00592.1 hypothetical protein L861_06540 [Halomonas anticariensis FP35 = DSM 16096]
MASIDFLPRRLNEVPVVFRGMTGREVGLMAVGGFALGVPAGIVSALVLGAIAMVPTVASVTAGLALWFGGTVMRRLRRGRTTTWFYRRLQWKLASAGLPLGEGETLITRSTVFRIGRDTRGRGGRP